jgi:hypothetical protein
MTMTKMKALLVLVPRPGTRAAQFIDPGSGIVTDSTAEPLTTEHGVSILVYYEGNRFGAVNIQTLEDKVLHAAGRLDQQYPTVAMGVFLRTDFIPVGTFIYAEDWTSHYCDLIQSPALAEWRHKTNPARRSSDA